MMRVAAALAFLFFSTTAAASVETYTPVRISFSDLAKIPHEKDGSTTSENSAAKALSQALEDVGMISITEIPSFGCKIKTLNSLRDCIVDSPAAVEHTFPDGTVRRTIATHCAAGKADKIQHSNDDPKSAAACGAFDNVSETFRQVVANVTDTLAMSLEVALNIPSDKTLLVSKSRSFSLVETIQQGEHLEHFHSYKSPQDAAVTVTETIEWHLDQGLALIFTPGLIKNIPTDGLFIRLNDGSEAMVSFEPQDELVVLLGDGVNQYVNPILGSSLRSVPHSLRMPKTNDELPRVWYGRMVLPPPSAIHPVHQKTFGDLRNAMMATSTTKDNEEAMQLGCSSSMKARHLNNITCEEGTFFCWHQCFNHTDEVSPEACESKELDLACINDARELWDGIHDKSFFPGCVDSSTAVNYKRPANHTNTTGNNNATGDNGDQGEGHDDSDNDEDLDDTPSASFGIVMSRSVAGATTMALISMVVVFF